MFRITKPGIFTPKPAALMEGRPFLAIIVIKADEMNPRAPWMCVKEIYFRNPEIN